MTAPAPICVLGCPFCGERPTLTPYVYGYNYVLQCDSWKCVAGRNGQGETWVGGHTRVAAAKRWNRRVPMPRHTQHTWEIK